MMTRSQTCEDVILYRLFGRQTTRFYIDVCAMIRISTLHQINAERTSTPQPDHRIYEGTVSTAHQLATTRAGPRRIAP